jgi:hypothetical protein
LGALGFVPLVNAFLEPRRIGQRAHVVGRACQLQDALADPFFQRGLLVPRTKPSTRSKKQCQFLRKAYRMPCLTLPHNENPPSGPS